MKQLTTVIRQAITTSWRAQAGALATSGPVFSASVGAPQALAFHITSLKGSSRG